MCSWQGVNLCLMLICALAFPAGAQTVNLEELEARLEREQVKEAARQAEANRRARAAAAQGTLVMRADADCSLLVNGVNQGRLQANTTTSVKANPGQQLIECDGGDGRRVEAIETLASGEQKVVRLTVPPPPRFVRMADGVQDNEQGIVWAASDNGSDIDWNGAKSYCASRGGGWSLPTVAQAQGMFGASGQYQQQRSSQFASWKIQPATDLVQFSPGSAAVWTSEPASSLSAFYVTMDSGSRSSFPVSHLASNRALCVRRRP